jgi:hypothetical protein
MDEIEQVYAAISGGPEFVAWFGRIPRFHDAEIVSLKLFRTAPSTISIHTWNMTKEVDARGYFILDRHAVVTFTLEDIIDLQLDSFSIQNVINGLKIRISPEPPEPRPAEAPSSKDWEIEFEPCFGLHGKIRCRNISISFVAGKPNDFRQCPT